MTFNADENGTTALRLRIAAAHGHADEVSQLISAGANVKKQNKDGMNALGIAVAGRYTDIVSQLISVR